MQPTSLKRPTLLRRIAAALTILSPRPLCSLVDSPLPELNIDHPEEGRIAQSLYVGLMMHCAFDGGTDDTTFADAYRLLAGLAPPQQ